MTNTATSYVREMKSIKDELKRMQLRSKQLKEQKKKAESRLYHYMKNQHLEEFEGVKIKTITPKDKTFNKKASDKKHDAIKVLYEAGIPDPEGLWEELKRTQKVKIEPQS
jgi:hypothetical protein